MPLTDGDAIRLDEERFRLYFVGLKFRYSKSSEQIHGVGRDAGRIVDAIAAGHREVHNSRDEESARGV